MTLVPHWRRVLWHAWSLWPGYLAFVLEVASELVPYVSHWLPWWVPPAIILLTPILRIIRQEKLHAGPEAPREPSRVRTHSLRRRRFGQWLRRNLPWSGSGS